MKKAISLLLMVLLCFGCQKQTLEDQQFVQYNKIKDSLENQVSFDTNYPFHVSLIFNQLEDRYRYDIVIDQVQADMYHIVAMSATDTSLDDMNPNLGIFDESLYHLRKDYIDKTNGFYKGIRLSGTCQDMSKVKLYICYYSDQEETKKIEKYIEVSHDEIR